MVTIDVRITNKQLEFIKKKAGKRSVPSELTDLVMNMLDDMIRLEEYKDGKATVD